MASSTRDPFDIFDTPAEAPDPFDVFDTPAVAPVPKRSRTSPVLAVVRSFALKNAASICAALPLPAAAHLTAAVDSVTADPADLPTSRVAAERAAACAWAALTDGIQTAVDLTPWRQGYALAQVLLCAVSAALEGDTERALCSLDRAFILGGNTQLFRDCSELLLAKSGSPAAPPPAAPPQAVTPPVAASPSERLIDARSRWAAATPGLAAAQPVPRRTCPPSAEAFRPDHRACRALPGPERGAPPHLLTSTPMLITHASCPCTAVCASSVRLAAASPPVPVPNGLRETAHR